MNTVKGPFTYDPEGFPMYAGFVSSPEGPQGERSAIADVCKGPSAASNGAMLAASFELYEALKLVMVRCGPKSQDGAIARAAIAKAEGRAL